MRFNPARCQPAHDGWLNERLQVLAAAKHSWQGAPRAASCRSSHRPAASHAALHSAGLEHEERRRGDLAEFWQNRKILCFSIS